MRQVEYENLHFLNYPFFDDYRASFNDTLERGWFILGKNVEIFEQQFAKYIGSKYVIGVASGLDALEIPLKCWDFEPRSEIIVPSNTYIATINAIINCGHIPVFVEPDILTYNIDCQKIEEKITSKTRAIMLVHLYGRPCEMNQIMALCQKHNLELVEDCAQSHAATFDGKMTGTFGVGAFSFYPTKNLGALGDAGAIATNDEAFYLKIKAWRNYGSNIKYKNEYIGDNSRLDEIQAGFLTKKLNHLDAITTRKNEIAQYYLENLDKQFILPTVDERILNAYHIFPVRHPERDKLKAYLLENGIKTEIHYPIAPCDQKSIQDWARNAGVAIDEKDFVLSREIHKTELSLPISTIHSDEDIAYVVEMTNKFSI
ncbi:MAG: DegT/DnrJ/EryC1/StrS family aminotransferase [Saprospiraceae bacterium]|nr:DegT/DnrJ/EryC1/StrS family aminotransferase [Saprospiraceae bacterium]